MLYSYIYRQLKKLDEDSLTKQPEEVFDVLEKLGEGYVFLLMCASLRTNLCNGYRFSGLLVFHFCHDPVTTEMCSAIVTN